MLAYHSLDVAAVGSVLLEKHPRLVAAMSATLGLSPEVFRTWSIYFLAVHDVGKFAQSFQALAPDVFNRLQHKKPTKIYNPENRHDTLGYALWRERLWQHVVKAGDPFKLGNDLPDYRDALQIWAECVTGHHGQPPVNGFRSLGRDFAESDIAAASAFIRDLDLLLIDAAPAALDIDQFEWAMPAASWWLAGMAVFCDWLGSNQDYFPYETDPGVGLEPYWQRALKQADNAVAQSGALPAGLGAPFDIQALLPEHAQPSDLQQLANSLPLSKEPQVFILEDLTGSGKTEAAVMLAHRIMQQGDADGVFFALPTMATANAMYQRIRHFHRLLFAAPEQASLVLAHSQRRLVAEFSASVLMPDSPPEEAVLLGANEETASARCAAWLADNTKKALLASVGVGTIDQALMAILHSRHQSLRLLGLFRKVLIVDEVHANDAYVHRLLCVLLRFHAAAGGSAILLSATLPQNMRQELLAAFARGRNHDAIEPLVENSYPLLTQWSSSGIAAQPVTAPARAQREVAVRIIQDSKSAFDLITDAANAGHCVCWIRNTVNDAVASYKDLQSTLGDQVELFHARFMMGDRLDIEQAIQKRFGKDSTPDERCGRVLVATQVVEQSLDLDFDVMLSDLAPIDLLIQRAGRLHRHPRDQAGGHTPNSQDQRAVAVLHVLAPAPIEDADKDWIKRFLPGTAAVYPDPAILWRTAKLLLEHSALRMPDDARVLIEGVYGEAKIDAPAPLTELAQQVEGQNSADRSLGNYNSLKFNEGYRAGSQRWYQEAHTPTRLGEPTSQLCLLAWDGVRLQPLYQDETHFELQMSQVSIRRWNVAEEAESAEAALKEAIESFKRNKPYLKKWLVLVPMMQDAGQGWYGKAVDQQGRPVELLYAPVSGLSVKRLDK